MAIFDSSTERVVTLFEQKFEEADGRLVFRKSLRAPGVAVSRDERDRFVADFRRQVKWLYRGFMAALLAVCLSVVFAFVSFAGLEGDPPPVLIYGPIILLSLIVFGLQRWFLNAPARALEGRMSLGDGRSKAEAQRIALARVSWPQLGVGVLALAYGLWRLSIEFDLTKGWGLLVWPAFALAGAMGLRTAWRKWRAERKG